MKSKKSRKDQENEIETKIPEKTKKNNKKQTKQYKTKYLKLEKTNKTKKLISHRVQKTAEKNRQNNELPKRDK